MTNGYVDGGKTLAPGKERHRAEHRPGSPGGEGPWTSVTTFNFELLFPFAAAYTLLANQYPSACLCRTKAAAAHLAWNHNGGAATKMAMETQKKRRAKSSWFCRWKGGICYLKELGSVTCDGLV